jgi:steroid 5-alpha reductase family enzyme
MFTTLLSIGFVGLPAALFVLFIIALVVSSVGFYRTVYFISIGYAFSITVMVAAMIVIGYGRLNWITAIQEIGLLAWSLRLGIYLLQREAKPVYREAAERSYQSTARVTLPVKFTIWISVSLLYVAMFSPALFSVSSNAPTSPIALFVQILGLLVMIGGLVLESLADKQKADFKAQNPSRFCDVGLYRWVRCPNYLGEILFWVGNFIIGVVCYTSIAQWAISFIGMACITLIMMGSTKRLERSQAERYGDRPEYQAYISTIPVLVPFVPIYTLKNVRVYLE